jgi:hypothetical protein
MHFYLDLHNDLSNGVGPFSPRGSEDFFKWLVG